MATIELRIHGVGNSPDAEVLDQADVAEAHGRIVTRFRWGNLVSGSRWFMWWATLFPFTLANVAGWMRPAGRQRTSAVVRILTSAICLTLTATTAAWFAVGVIDLGAWQVCGHFMAYPRLRILGGAAICALIGWIGHRLADQSRAQAEATTALLADSATRTGWSDEQRLFNPSFFAHEADYRLLAAIHTTVWMSVVAAAAWIGIGRVGVRPNALPRTLRLGDIFVTIGSVQWALVALLAAVCVVFGGGIRALGPAVLTGLAVILSNAMWSGGVRAVGGAIDLVLSGSGLVYGPEMALQEAFLAQCAAAVVALAVAWFWPRANAPHAARLVRRAPLVGAVTVATGLAVGTALFFTRVRMPANWWRPLPLRFADLPHGGWAMASAGLAMAVAVATIALMALTHGTNGSNNAANALSRIVASVWEVASFWPRRFHPFAVRPYSEIAVPKLADTVLQSLAPRRSSTAVGDTVVISAHSQGSVLAVTALCGLSGAGMSLRGAGLVSHGSPLASVYERLFPHFFSDDSLAALSSRLGDPDAIGPRWINAYRLSDPIAGPLGGTGSALGPPGFSDRVIATGSGHAWSFGTPEVLAATDEVAQQMVASTAAAVLPPPDRVVVREMPMVGWYEPPVLAQSALRLATADVTAPFADRREARAALTADAAVIDVADVLGPAAGPRWVDFVADVGDGYDPTFAVAWHLMRAFVRPGSSPALTAVDPTAPMPNPTTVFPAADVLVIGGDLSYPVGDSGTYADRLIGPYQRAADATANLTTGVFAAIPGNHDWFDGLVGFTGLTQPGNRLGRWRAVQERSYCALRVHPKWVILCVDGGPSGHDFDIDQRRWFHEMAATFAPTDNFVVVAPVPVWMDGSDEPAAMGALDTFLVECLGGTPESLRRVRLYLSGDSHHYAHLVGDQDNEEVHYVTAGGGGAFTHPTHNIKRSMGRDSGGAPVLDLFDPTGRFGKRRLRFASDKALFPSRGESRQILLRLLGFAGLNPTMAVVLGSVAVMAAVSCLLTVSVSGGLVGAIRTSSVSTLLTGVWRSPATWLVALFVVGSLVVFAKPRNRTTYRVWQAKIVGLAHGIAQAVAASIYGVAAVKLAPTFAVRAGTWKPPLLSATFSVASMTVIGAALLAALVIGSLGCGTIFGLYLGLSNLIFGIHDNESFSALRLTAYKNFLRLQFDDHSVRVHPIGLRRVRTRHPGDITLNGGPSTVSTDLASDPAFIEEPFEVAYLPQNEAR